MDRPDRTLYVNESSEVPWLSIVFGYGPMLPLAAGALGAWALKGEMRTAAILLTVGWGILILAFLSGVRRGLSFRTGGGPTLEQIATMFGLFVLAGTALAAAALRLVPMALVALLCGFTALMVLDPRAARRGEAPLFFARLRSPQMAIAVASLVALLANTMLR